MTIAVNRFRYRFRHSWCRGNGSRPLSLRDFSHVDLLDYVSLNQFLDWDSHVTVVER
jgi:hypothetical protein